MSAQTTEKTTQTSLKNLRPEVEKIQNLPSVSVGLTSLQGFELVQRAAKCLAASSLVPKDYIGNIPNCVVALNMAARVGADPLMVMQNLVIVHGRPTWSSQFMIATANSCGRFSALRYEFFGEKGKDSYGCRAWAVELSTGEKLVGTDVSIKLAKDEKWYDKNGSKWKTMEQQMLMYRAGSWWVRAYAPELSMGLHTNEEVHDVWDATKDENGSYSVDLSSLRTDATDGATIVDGATGEIIDAEAKKEPDNDQADDTPALLQPKAISTKPLAGDATKTDWDDFCTHWEKMVNIMADEQSLNKLQALNAKNLEALSRENPPKHTWALETLAIRVVHVGGIKKGAE